MCQTCQSMQVSRSLVEYEIKIMGILFCFTYFL